MRGNGLKQKTVNYSENGFQFIIYLSVFYLVAGVKKTEINFESSADGLLLL